MGTVSLFRSSSMVERLAVNERVVGSSPTCGAQLDNELVQGLYRMVFAM